MTEPTIAQKRARHAWDAIQTDVKGQSFSEGYSALAKNAPADIMANGLGQTAAFWHAKRVKRQEANALLGHVSQWLIQQMVPDDPQPPELVDWIAHLDNSDEYLRATMEALAYLVWIKRFAEGELDDAQVHVAR